MHVVSSASRNVNATRANAAASIVAQDAQNLEQRIAALKQSMAQSQAQLRKYEWVESTICVT